MPKSLIYTGSLGPAIITCAGMKFAKGQPRPIEDDALAVQLLAKGCFVEDKSKPAARAAQKEE